MERSQAEATRNAEAGPSGQRLSEDSIGELVQRLTEQTSVLVRQEVGLAQAELKEKGKRAGIGAGLFGGAGALGFYTLGALIATAILALSEAVDGWLAGLIVTVVLGAAAAVAALVGRQQVQKATPPVPEHARDSVQEDIRTVKESATR
jgi:putative superfamily III holin-X